MDDSITPFDAILAAYNHDRKSVSQALGVTPQAVDNWRRGHRAISPETAIKLEEYIGAPKWLFRPDLWPPPKKLPAKHCAPLPPPVRNRGPGRPRLQESRVPVADSL